MTGDDREPSDIEALLQEGVRDAVFPGAVAALGKLGGRRVGEPGSEWSARAGLLAPGELTVQLETPYDLASLTKPFVAVTALRLAQQRVVDLQLPVAHYLPELEESAAGESTLALLLSHRAGLAAYGRLFAESEAPPGSVEARRFILHEAARRRDESAGTGRSVYSDLGYLVAGETLARAAGLDLAALVQREVTRPLGIDGQIYYAAALDESRREALRARVAPTEQCAYRGYLVRGEVHDENCHAFGGVAGHAGLFGTARAVLQFGIAVLTALEGRSSWLDQALIRWALAPRGPGYVVGWDSKSPEGSSAGTLFSERSFGQLGFTGTSIWCDPTRRLCGVLLSNRVHPTRENLAIRGFRPHFYDALVALAGSSPERD